MDGFSVGDIQLPADFEQQIAAQLAANGYNFAVQPGAQTAAAPQTAATNFAVQPGVSDINYGAPDQTGVASTFAVQPGAEGLRDPNPPTSGVASTLAVPTQGTVNKTGMVTERGMAPDFAVQPTPGVTVNPTGLTEPNTPTVSATPSAPFDYSKLVTGEPQLQTGPLQLSSGRSFTPETPYYTAYTNSGDAAGAVYAGEGQKVRLVDPRTGDVVFEGTGPEGAKQAVAIANATSSSQGRKASWQIQGDFGDQGWKAMAEDKVDPKHNLLGKLADIALPVLGAILAVPTGGASLGAFLASQGANAAVRAGIGSALGSALSSTAQGRSLKDALLRAGISGVTAGVGQSLSGALSVPGAGVTSAAPTITTSTLPAALPSVAGMTGQQVADAAAKGLLEEVVIQGTRQLIPTAAGIAAGLGGALSSAVGAPSATGAGTNASATTQSQPTDVGEVVVTGARPTPPTLAPAVSELVVTAARSELDRGTPPKDVIDRYGDDVFNAAIGAIDPLTVTAQPEVNRSVLPGAVSGLVNTLPSVTPKTLVDAVKTGDPKVIGDWIAANPLQAAALGVTAASLLGGGGGGGGGGSPYTVPTGAGAPGTRGSLSPIFSAGLPPPTGRFAARQPRDMRGVDWKRYGMGPERSFFTTVPMSVAERKALAAQGRTDYPDYDPALGYAEGGHAQFAVRGDGDGREDAIPAKLSDGEYVIDAETVALLGNGSSKAGAAKLDRFRVNVRKHKGRELAKGKFSADAKRPEAYLAGGRT